MSDPTTEPVPSEPTPQPEPTTTPTPAQEPAPVKAEDWRAMLNDDLRNDPNISKFKDPNALAQSYISASKMIGRDKVAIPNEHSGEQEWAAFYKAGGMPETADAYSFKAPEDLPEGVYSDEMATWFKGEAHKAGLNPQQAARLHDSWVQHLGGRIAAEGDALEQGRATAEAELRKEWGVGFDARIMAGRHLVQEFGGEDFDAYLVESKLGNDPRMARFLAKMASKMKGDSGLTGSFETQTPADIDQEIAAYRDRNAKVLYDKMHPDHKRLTDGLTRLYQKKHAAA